MRCTKVFSPGLLAQGSVGARARQIAVVAIVLWLTGCGTDESGIGAVGYVEGFLGGVVADEPQAAQIGRDVLSAGGSAADAVVAMYFTEAVTLPSSAALGGGGVCLGFDPEKREVSAVEFLARRPARIAEGADRPTAVPGNIRGMFAFHARFGRLRWSQLLAPAEHLARFGFQVSRALASEIRPVARALRVDPQFAKIFAAPDGRKLVSEGDFVEQIDLAAVLGRIRAEGAGAFYSGALARKFSEAVPAAGGSIAIEDLRGYRPAWRETIRVPLGNEVVHFMPPPPPGGALAAEMWRVLLEEGSFAGAGEGERLRQLAALGILTAADRSRWPSSGGAEPADAGAAVEARIRSLAAELSSGAVWTRAASAPQAPPENPSASTLIAVDRDGSGAACAVTLNSLFGTGRIAPGTGIVLAAAPGPGGRGATALGPVLVVNHNVGELFFAAAASGGAAAPTSLVGVMARTLLGERPLPDAIAAKRVVGGIKPGVVAYEEGYSAPITEAFAGLGVRLVATPPLGRVNAIACPGGIPPKPETCRAATDPRGFGLAVTSD